MHCKDKEPVFMFTNENVREYITDSGLFENKNVLTVAASGDQAFESVLAGAKHVDTFDINGLQKNVMDIKTTMIRNLDYNKFMDFFFFKHSRFHPHLIAPIADKLGENNIDILTYILYEDFYYLYNVAESIKNASYLHSSDKYKDLQVRLPEHFNFKHMDILKQAHEITQSYDIILLSNILTEPGKRFKKQYDTVLKPLSERLTPDNGVIFFDYSWFDKDVTEKDIIQTREETSRKWNPVIQKNQHVETKLLESNNPGTAFAMATILQQSNSNFNPQKMR
jgi:hypothetical protein